MTTAAKGKAGSTGCAVYPSPPSQSLCVSPKQSLCSQGGQGTQTGAESLSPRVKPRTYQEHATGLSCEIVCTCIWEPAMARGIPTTAAGGQGRGIPQRERQGSAVTG